MEIVPNQNFRDARSIPARFNRFDSRSESFHEPEVIVDLRECTRIHSPGVLWCAVYLGTQDSYRGIGLYETVEKMRIPGRHLIIHSGNGIISKGEKLTTRITSTKLFPGTIVYISIPT